MSKKKKKAFLAFVFYQICFLNLLLVNLVTFRMLNFMLQFRLLFFFIGNGYAG